MYVCTTCDKFCSWTERKSLTALFQYLSFFIQSIRRTDPHTINRMRMLCILSPLVSIQEFLFYLDSFSFYYFCDLKGRHSNLVRRGCMVLRDLAPAGHPSRHLPWETHTAELWLSRKRDFQGQSPTFATTGFPLDLKMTKVSHPSHACFRCCTGPRQWLWPWGCVWR